MMRNYKLKKRPKCLHLVACTILIALLAATAATGEGSLTGSELEQQQQRQLDSSEINGWTEVSELWPLEDSEFFVSFEKGHHYIEVKLPSIIDKDFKVKLEYFYNYAKARPLLQLIACTNQIDLLAENRSQANGTWLQHETRLKSSDCDKRKVLTYNVVLHDDQDIFAWRQIEIESIVEPETQAEVEQPPQETTPVEVLTSPSTQETGETSSSGSGENPETTVGNLGESQTTPATTTTTNGPEPTTGETETAPETIAPPETTSKGPDAESTIATTKPETDLTITTSQPITEVTTTVEPNSETTTTAYMRDLNERKKTAKPYFPPEPPATENGDNVPRTKREISSEDGSWFMARMKRSADNREHPKMVCKPSSCDKSRFVHPRFIPLVRGIPKVPIEEITNGAHKFFLSTNEKPLNFTFDYRGDLTEVDLCTDFRLFMDDGTSVDLLLEDELLERIERRPSDSAAGQWEIFKRCISDYMPRLPAAGRNVHSVKMALVPHKQHAKQVAVFLKKEDAFPLRVLYPMRDYLPNIDRLDESSLNAFWVTDKDGVQKPRLKLGGDSGRKLQISNIDSKQEYFDLTSRWMQIKDLEILEAPVLFVYAAERAPWVKSIEFEYQNAKHASGWISQTVYLPTARTQQPETNSMPATQATELPTTNSSEPGATSSAQPTGSSTTTTTTTTTQTPQQVQTTATVSESELLIPIMMKNLNSNEFRIRTRHHLSEAARLEDSLELNIITLAFGDVCAQGNYCLNKGTCQPIRAARAECTCLAGYSGNRCEIVRPCEVIYGNQTGKALCESIGARCAEDLTEFRCRWPGDPEYGLSNPTNTTGGGEAIPLPSSEDWNQLKESSDKQARMIIVMGVFMLAFLLFAVVIVANMVSRLMRSKRRLKQSQIEVHELSSRRPDPPTSGSGAAMFGGRSVGRHKQPPAAISYNNQSFDAD